MRFVRKPEDAPPAVLPRTPGERLVRRTGAGLAIFTLALIAILLLAVGLVTATAAIGMTDQSVDTTLHTASENMLSALAPTPTPTPPALQPTSTPEHGDESDHRTPRPETKGGDDGEERQSTPAEPTPREQQLVVPAAPPLATQDPSPAPTSSLAPAGHVSAPVLNTENRSSDATDTFYFVLDDSGRLRSDPQRAAGPGLPNAEAVAIALAGADDLRTVSAQDVRVRLLTEPMHALDGTVSGALQTGIRLTAYDEQKQIVLRTILVASLCGLLGAAVVTWFVTRRAMAPIRTAFEAERRFVAAASHELKTPVAIVRASAEILEREDLVKPEGRYLVDDVVAESDRLGRLVGDLLALASAEAGQISISATDFDMRPVVDEVVERVRVVAEERGVRVEATPDDASTQRPDDLLVRADRDRMIQLLTIFIDNAIDHSPPNGVVSVVAHVVDDGPRSAQRVAVDVADQGPGVPIEERERIFEPFAKVSGRRRTTGTTGLGLAIARILATRQDATISVRDARGGGALFSVSLARRPHGG